MIRSLLFLTFILVIAIRSQQFPVVSLYYFLLILSYLGQMRIGRCQFLSRSANLSWITTLLIVCCTCIWLIAPRTTCACSKTIVHVASMIPCYQYEYFLSLNLPPFSSFRLSACGSLLFLIASRFSLSGTWTPTRWSDLEGESGKPTYLSRKIRARKQVSWKESM